MKRRVVGLYFEGKAVLQSDPRPAGAQWIWYFFPAILREMLKVLSLKEEVRMYLLKARTAFASSKPGQEIFP